MNNTTTLANSHLAADCAVWGLSPLPGVNAFGMLYATPEPTAASIKLERQRKADAIKRASRKSMSKEQISALAMRSPEERKADRAAMLKARKAEVLKVRAFSGVGYADQATTDKIRRISRAAI